MPSELKKTEDLALLALQMESCLQSGMTASRALRTATRHHYSKPLRQLLTKASSRMEQGCGYAESLDGPQRGLPSYSVPFLAAAEESGQSAEAFAALGRLGQQLVPILRNARQLWLIPMTILGFGIICRLAIMFFLGANQDAISMITESVTSLLILAITTRLFLKTRAGRAAWDRLMISIPYLGGMHRAISLSLFFQGFGFTYRAGGQDISRMIRKALDAVPNSLLRHDLSHIVTSIESGHTLAEAVTTPTLIDDATRQTLSTGALVGRLEEALDEVTNQQQKQLEGQLIFAKSFLAPLLGFLVIGSIYSTILLFI